jgi:hypothetical protein
MPGQRDSGFLSFMSRSKDENAQAVSARTKVGSLTRQTQARALTKYPSLAIEPFSADNHGKNLMLIGVNSIRAELLDLATMMLVMDENAVKLTHTAVDRFFEWLPMFYTYLERYFFVEEDMVIGPLTRIEGPLKGKMRQSSRMVLIGSIQREAKDIIGMQELFLHSLPAGQRIGKLSSEVDIFVTSVIHYLHCACEELSTGLNKQFSKVEIEKIRLKIANYVTSHVGTEEFLVLYTRWMQTKELLEWKARVLLRKDFQFFAYTIWEKNMDDVHFSLVRKFAEKLKAENDEAEGNVTENEAADFLRHKQAARERQRELEPDGDIESDMEEVEGECDEEEEASDADK